MFRLASILVPVMVLAVSEAALAGQTAGGITQLATASQLIQTTWLGLACTVATIAFGWAAFQHVRNSGDWGGSAGNILSAVVFGVMAFNAPAIMTAFGGALFPR